MCPSCGSNLPCDCSLTRQPFCSTCLKDDTCDVKVDAKCVYYHLDTTVASNLTCIGIGNKINLEAILEKIDNKLCSFQSFQTNLTTVNTPTINFATSGTALHTLTGAVNISTQTENNIVSNSDGLFSSVKIANGNCINFEKTIVNGQVIYTPTIDMNCLSALICAMCLPTTCSGPTNLAVTGASITWNPSASSNNINQQVKKRIKGLTPWDTAGFTPSNNLAPNVSAATTVLQPNTIYEFQVDTLCTIGGPTSSTTRESIVFNCSSVPAFTGSSFSSTTINPGVLPTFAGSNTLNYYVVYLYNSTGTTLLQTSASVNFGSPAPQFTGLIGSTTYILKFALFAIVNGSNNSSTQCASSSFTTSPTFVCIAPTGLISSAVTTTTFTESWNTVTGATAYEYSLNSGSWTNIGNTLTTTFTGLISGTNYTFNIRAIVNGASCIQTSSNSVITQSLPTFVEVSNVLGASVRTQIGRVGTNMITGSIYQVIVYSHIVSYTSLAGDTPTSVALAIANLVNATSTTNWNSAGWAPANGTTGFPPTATSSGGDITLTLNTGNQFGFNVT